MNRIRNQLPMLFFIILFILQVQITNGQSQIPSRITIKQNFGEKNKYKFDLEKYSSYYLNRMHDTLIFLTERNKYFRLDLFTNFKTNTELELKVNKVKNKLFSCSWKYGNTRITGINEDLLSENIKRSFSIYDGMKIDFTCDNEGKILEFSNYTKCKDFLMNAYTNLFSNRNLSVESLNESMNLVSPTFEDNKKMLDIHFEELNDLFSIFGSVLETNTSNYSFSKRIDSRTGNDCTLISITQIDSIQSNYVYISVRQSTYLDYNDSIAKERSYYFYRLLGKDLMPRTNLSINSFYIYDYKKNTIKEFYCQKIYDYFDFKEIENIKVVLIN